jgi:hypothetical protein
MIFFGKPVSTFPDHALAPTAKKRAPRAYPRERRPWFGFAAFSFTSPAMRR